MSINLPDAWADRLVERAPRLALLAVVAMAWAMTLAWPPLPSGSRTLVAGQPNATPLADYPLRLDLPDTQPVTMEELIAVVGRHEPIAQASKDISARSAGTVKSSSSSIRTSFAAAFSAFLDPAPAGRSANGGTAQQAPATQKLGRSELLSVDYDLAKLNPSQPTAAASETVGSKAAYNSEDGSLTVTKQLLVDGKSRGSATIRIEERARILIATASVADALGPQVENLPRRISGAIATRTGFIPFHELRGAGIAVEYDPVTDRVSLSTNS
ncbi:hypothetical protein [Altererythrobacter litoralis]|uniref:Copper amine oxidase-like N-terminal domain-containing protein n=1 Tax=Altererythrobacter litoralis TaxID=3113904 RepID=A0ABU7GDU5_9SPHN|nr:hypothetical protein [Erythrobacteraceae bacterium 1XM1-14]